MAQHLNDVMWKQLLQRSARENMSLQGQIREMLVARDPRRPAARRRAACPRAARWPSSSASRATRWCWPTSNSPTRATWCRASAAAISSTPTCWPGGSRSRARPAQAASGARATPDWARALPAAAFAAAQHRQAGGLAEVPASVPLRPVRRRAVPHGRLARVLHQGAERARHPRLGARPDHARRRDAGAADPHPRAAAARRVGVGRRDRHHGRRAARALHDGRPADARAAPAWAWRIPATPTRATSSPAARASWCGCAVDGRACRSTDAAARPATSSTPRRATSARPR